MEPTVIATPEVSRQNSTQKRVKPSGARGIFAALTPLLLLISSVGCNQLLGLGQVTARQPNAYVCDCTCTSQNNIAAITVQSAVCLPANLNPNLNSNSALTQADLDSDCNMRVHDNVQGLVSQCVSHSLGCSCSADLISSIFAAGECDQPCTGEDLVSNCSNWNTLSHPPHKTATNVPGQPPVCLVASSDPPNPVPDPLAAGIFGHTSSCDVAADITITRAGDTETQSGNGTVNFTGGPCAGGGCQVGMSYRLNHINDFSFSGFAGFDGVVFENLFASGASVPEAATLDAFGKGTLAASSTQSFGEGKRSNQILGAEVSSDQAAYLGTNSTPISVAVDWQNHMCEVSGALLGQIEDKDTSVSSDLSGTIINEPPTANAGANQNVECTSTTGAGITLDGSHSTDPEGNIALFVWRQGTRAGQEIGYSPMLDLNQDLGGNQTYFLRVVDAFGQSSESSTSVTVVDTTPPVITAVAATPNVLWSPNHTLVPVSVAVSDSDQCDPAPTCKIVEITSNEPLTSSDARITGNLTANLSAQRLGSGNGRLYTLTVQCSDASGNTSTTAATVSVPHDQKT